MNTNDEVEVKPTEAESRQMLEQCKHVNGILRKKYGDNAIVLTPPQPDEDGYIKGGFWRLMERIGHALCLDADEMVRVMRLPQEERAPDPQPVTWFRASTPPPSESIAPILVAVEIDDHVIVTQGAFTRRGEMRAIGINAEPYAWAYMPQPPERRHLISLDQVSP